MIGISYAYFNVIVVGNEEASTDTITAGELILEYDGEESFSLKIGYQPLCIHYIAKALNISILAFRKINYPKAAYIVDR